MPSIDLQSGFDFDSVTIRVNDAEVFSKESVTTQRLTGFAERIELRDLAKPAVVEINMNEGAIQHKFTVNRDDNFHVGVWIEDGRVQHAVSDRPFGYA